MEFLYAREQIQSPEHLPNWWDPGTSYPRSHERAIEAAWEQDKFDLLIFAHGDRDHLPEKILAVIQTRYVLVPGTKTIDVYRPASPESR